jgi:SAM-dependent methyltransferase
VTGFGRHVVAWCDAWNRNHPWDHDTQHHRWILRRLPARVERVIATARERTASELPVHYAVADLDGLDPELRDEVVTALAVLHHGPFEPALARLRDLLAPGGTLVVLGLYREETGSDVLLSLLAVPANLVVGWAKNFGHHRIAASAPTAPASSPLVEIRAAAARQTPGATIRRQLFWRCSLVSSAAR